MIQELFNIFLFICISYVIGGAVLRTINFYLGGTKE